MTDDDFWRQQRDALIMQVAAIEKRLGMQRTVCCPQCQHSFAPGARSQKQMHDRSRDNHTNERTLSEQRVPTQGQRQ